MSENEEIAGTIPEEDIEAAEKLKNEANELFKSIYFLNDCYKSIYIFIEVI